jgi:ketosteroid isomerase-like protein
MTRRNWMTRFLTAAALSWCEAARAQTSNRSLADAVGDAERAFADSMAKRDLTAFASHVSNEAVFFSSPDGLEVLRGKDAIVEGWRRYFNGPTAPFSWSPATAQVLDSGTLGMTTGPVRNEKGEATGRFSSVWRLEPDGKWRVIFDRGCNCGEA